MWSQTAGIHSIKPSLKIDSRPAPRPAGRQHPARHTASGQPPAPQGSCALRFSAGGCSTSGCPAAPGPAGSTESVSIPEPEGQCGCGEERKRYLNTPVPATTPLPLQLVEAQRYPGRTKLGQRCHLCLINLSCSKLKKKELNISIS